MEKQPDNRLTYETTERERIKQLENELLMEQTRNKHLEHELNEAIDQQIDLKTKLEMQHKDETHINYKEKYLKLKDALKSVMYDTFIQDGATRNE